MDNDQQSSSGHLRTARFAESAAEAPGCLSDGANPIGWWKIPMKNG